jgi:hypothetical protein
MVFETVFFHYTLDLKKSLRISLREAVNSYKKFSFFLLNFSQPFAFFSRRCLIGLGIGLAIGVAIVLVIALPVGLVKTCGVGKQKKNYKTLLQNTLIN